MSQSVVNLAVIPVAGLGTRMLPATKAQPKEMLPVGRKPVVQYVVEELARANLQRLLFVTGPNKAAIENHFDVNHELIQTLRETGKEELLAELAYERAPLQYFYTRQRQLLGLGHAVWCAQAFVGAQPFVVALGDSLIGLRAQSDIVSRLVQCFTARHAAAVIAFEEVPASAVKQYGIAQAGEAVSDDVFTLSDIIEKPSIEEAPSRLAVAARYVFAPTIFAALARTPIGKGGELQLTDAIRILIQNGEPVYGLKLRAHEQRYDIGSFETYFRAFVEFALADEQYGADLRAYLNSLTA